MNVAYTMVSTGKQDLANQRYEIERFAERNNIIIDQCMAVKIMILGTKSNLIYKQFRMKIK